MSWIEDSQLLLEAGVLHWPTVFNGIPVLFGIEVPYQVERGCEILPSNEGFALERERLVLDEEISDKRTKHQIQYYVLLQMLQESSRFLLSNQLLLP